MKSKYYDIAAVREAITSIVPSISTPFLENGDVDFATLKSMTDFLIESGAKTLLITLGDSLLSVLTDREVFELTRTVVDAADHRAMVIGCTKQWCLPQAIEFANACVDMGCDMVIPTPPDWAHHCTADNLQKYYETIGAIAPVMLLSNLTSGRGIPMSLYEKMGPEQGIMAVKDDMPGNYGRRMGPIIKDKMAFLSGGRVENFLDTAPYGADGYLSIFARMFPELEKPYFKAIKEGRYAEAAYFVDTIEAPFLDWCAQNSVCFDAAIRGMMEIAGVAKRYARFPYSSLSDEKMDSLKQWLQSKNII